MNEKGFTLLEVILSVAILSVALIPMMDLIPRTLTNSLKSERETKVAFLAEQKIEEVKSQAINNFGIDYTISPSSPGYVAFANPTYKYSVTDNAGASIKEIVVSVWYDADGGGSANGDEETIQLSTKVAKRS